MNFILTYLFLGTIYMVAVELLSDHLIKEYKVYDVNRELTLMTRIMGILSWPIGLVVFLIVYFKTKFKK